MKEVTRHLSFLQARGLVYANNSRFSLDDGLRPYIERAWTSEEMRATAAGYYLGKATALQRLPRDPEEENVLCALDYYFQHGRWQQVVSIARSIDRYLACTGRWGQWRKRLDQAMQAAKELGDRATEAWAQNQLGIIAIGAGETSTAKQLFRSALSIRRALSDRPGAVVTRWNLRLVTVPPPTPWNRLLNKISSILQSGGLWLPAALAAVASLAILALLSIPAVIAGAGPSPTLAPVPLATTLTPSSTPLQPTVTPTPGQPSVEVWLADGCGGTFAPGTWLSIQARSSIAGRVVIYLVDPGGDHATLFEADIEPREHVRQARIAPEWEGTWTAKAILNDGQASDQCSFTVRAPTAPTVEIPTSDPPSPAPAISVWLPEGCGHTYEPGVYTEINFQANVPGQVDVYLSDLGSGGTQFLFNGTIQAGQVASRGWNMPEADGNWSLVAVLNGGQAREYCGFTVQGPTPTPEVDIELAGGCDQVYEPSAVTEIHLLASESGTVTVSLYDPAGDVHSQSTVDVTAGNAEDQRWRVPTGAGDWLLVAVLGDERASDVCRFTVQGPTPTPEVDIELAGGCDQVYEPSAVTEIHLLASESGIVTVSLYDPAGDLHSQSTADITAGKPEDQRWRVPERAGDWLLVAILGDERASDVCRFTVQGPKPTPEVDITLAEGCGQEFEWGTATQIRLWSSVDGSVDIFLSGPEDFRGLLFTEDVEANQDVYTPWTVSGGPEGWGLEAYLNDGQAEDYCSFRVKPIPKPEVWIETERGCGEVTYDQGAEIAISFGASVNGYLTVWLSGHETPFFADEVVGGKAYGLVLETDMAPGWKQLSADLEGEHAYAVCGFYVRETATVTPVETTPVPEKGTLPPEFSPTSIPEATATSPLARPTHTPSPTATPNPG
jgi:hypothetical protein